MKEKHPSNREQLSAGGSGLDSFFEDNDDGDLVRIASGPYEERLPVAYMTVGEIRARFRDRFDIDPRGQAVLDGIDAGDDTRVRPGQVLMFVHRVGEKGRGKSEVRNPKSEKRKRSEAPAPHEPHLSAHFRISDFGSLSEVGSRDSVFL